MCSRHPGQFLAAGEHRLLEVGVAAAVADVPLPGGDDLQRLVALLVEVGLALGRGRLAVAGRRTRGASSTIGLAGGEGGLAGELAPSRVGVGDPVRPVAQDPAVAADDHPGRQLQLAPPGHVGQVAEGAAHRDARSPCPARPPRAAAPAARPRTPGWSTVWPNRSAGSARRPDGRSAPRRRRSARAGWSRCRPAAAVRRGGRRPGGRRRDSPGPPARPGPPRSGRSRPTCVGASDR